VSYKYLGLATADYFYRNIVIFVVYISYLVAESQSTPYLSRHTGCLATQGYTLPMF
jgi:hypothetical protein